MKITYLLDDTALWGGVKVVFEQAEALHARGHEVTIVTKGPPPDWFELRVPLRRVVHFETETIPASEFVIATYWSTVADAVRAGRGAVIHLCQGYEGDFSGLAARRSEIEAVYRLPIPAMTVHEPITRLLHDRFGKRAVTVGEAVDHRLFQPRASRSEPAEPRRVLLAGPWEVDWKGVAEGLEALARAKRHVPLHVVRVAQFPQSTEERARGVVDEYHEALAPAAMAELYRSADLFLAPSWSAEGFGLPLLEALASGTPAAASDIPSFRAFAPDPDFVLFFAERDVGAMEQAIRRLAREPELRSRLRARGLEVARAYTYDRVVDRIERFLAAERVR